MQARLLPLSGEVPETDSRSVSFTIFKALQDVVWSCLWLQKVADEVQVPLRTSHKKRNLFSFRLKKKKGSPGFLVDALWFHEAEMKAASSVLLLPTLGKCPSTSWPWQLETQPTRLKKNSKGISIISDNLRYKPHLFLGEKKELKNLRSF